MVMVPRSGGLHSDKLLAPPNPPVCHYMCLCPFKAPPSKTGWVCHFIVPRLVTSPCCAAQNWWWKRAYLSSLTLTESSLFFTDPLQSYWHIDALLAGDWEEGWGMSRYGIKRERGGSQWDLMAFTIFNAGRCHHWISILNNVAFHHKFFTTYLLNGKSYSALSEW